MYRCQDSFNFQINNSIIYRINSSNIPMQTTKSFSTATDETETEKRFGNFSIANAMIIGLDFRK